jgi:protein-S-isoprenylcysteine O-methyltransferase Ste14
MQHPVETENTYGIEADSVDMDGNMLVFFPLLPLYFLTIWIGFASIPLPVWMRWGGGIVCLGIVMFGWAHQAFGNNWNAILALSKECEMVQSGLYRRVRHPMYSAFFGIGIGFLLLSSNGWWGEFTLCRCWYCTWCGYLRKRK